MMPQQTNRQFGGLLSWVGLLLPFPRISKKSVGWNVGHVHDLVWLAFWHGQEQLLLSLTGGWNDDTDSAIVIGVDDPLVLHVDAPLKNGLAEDGYADICKIVL
jgi:hypothetical protein